MTSDLDDTEVEEAVSRFGRSTRPAVLVADRTAEEGLNLQAADGLLLTDLPFAPERLEQRIGRLDRMGRRRPDIPTRVVLPDDQDSSPWLAWHELLRDGFGLYSRSISDVHFLLDDLRERIRLALFRRGAAGVADLADEIRAALDVERQRQDVSSPWINSTWRHAMHKTPSRASKPRSDASDNSKTTPRAGCSMC